MRLSRNIVITILVGSICLVSAGLSFGSTVAVDMANKTSKSDDKTLEVFGLQVSGQQAGICVNNKVAEPQIFTLRFTGLTESAYDLYINGASKGSKSAQQLQHGLQIRVDGSVCDPAMIRCLNSVSPGVQRLNDLLQKSKISEEQFVFDTMRQALGWVRLSLVGEQTWRSVRVTIGLKNKALEPVQWVARDSDYDTAGTITNACWLLQQARDQMYHQVKDPDLRNDAVVALTPIDFSASYSVKNGKPHLNAKLLNNCNLPLSGTISVQLPAGWKASGGKLKFSLVKPGQTFNLSCDLVGPTRTPALKEVPVVANITVSQLDRSASMKLTATAKTSSQ